MGKGTGVIELKEKLRSIHAKDIMSKSVITVSEDIVFAELAALMLEKRVSGVPVMRGDKVAGIITVTDLFEAMFVIKDGAVQQNGEKLVMNPKVAFFMSGKVFAIKGDTNLDEIMDIMKNSKIHTLPVMDGDKLLGIIGRRDVFRHFYRIVQGMCV